MTLTFSEPTSGIAPAQQPDALPVFNTLWIGDRLTAVHILCLLSAVRQGHQVRLFGYRRFPEVPGEIEQVDAGTVLPESEIRFHRATGSPAIFADRFRCELIARGYGAWMDADQLILRPVRAQDGFIAGWDNPTTQILDINNTVLMFPPESELAEELLWWSRQHRYVPPWLPRKERMKLHARRFLGLRYDSSIHRWGSTGPLLFAYCCHRHGYVDRVSPMTRFCPVPYFEKTRPFRADGDTETFFTDETEGVHLWHQGLRGGTNGKNQFATRRMAFEKGSFLWRMAGELDLPKGIAWTL